MNSDGRQKGIEEKTLFGTSSESGELKIVLLSLEDSLSRSSVVISILPIFAMS